jgi:hypothetical protein
MLFVSAGTDTFGRVKVVSGTAIVTKFFMFQMLPIFPLKSFYLIRLGKTVTSGIPIIAESNSREIVGIPLASVDITSVIMTYVRAILSAFLIFGVLGSMIMLIDHEPASRRNLTLTVLAIAVVGGAATYLLPLASKREQEIRQRCSEILGLAVDPARISPAANEKIVEHVKNIYTQADQSKRALVCELILTRASIPQSQNRKPLNDRTDELLAQLRKA